MSFTAPWLLFRRMQDSIAVASALIYAGAAVHAWRLLPWRSASKAELTLIWPGIFFLATLAVALALPPLRGALRRHLWISFRVGFGQSVISVLVGVAVLVVLAAVVFWQTYGAAHGGGDPAGVFSGYAAGVGLLLAEALLVRRFETDPQFRPLISER